MSYQAPGMVDAGERIPHERARTEVLAMAFADAAGSYFDRQKRYEDTITEAESRQRRMQQLGGGGVAGGILLIIIGLAGEALILASIGLVAALGVGIYAFSKYQDAKELILTQRSKLETNEPDGTVSFVSQIGVPLYLIPYQDQHMIFDGLNTAPKTNLELAYIDSELLFDNQQEVVAYKQQYDEAFGKESIIDPSVATQFAPDATDHRRLEQPIINQIDSMAAVAGNIERDTITAAVHANNQVAQSIRQLSRNSLLAPSRDIPEVSVRQQLNECEETVDDIRGVEEQAVSGDMLEQAQASRDRVEEITTELVTRLRTNQQRVEAHYDDHANQITTAGKKQVCPQCLEDRIETIRDELNLVDEILSAESGSLGMALSDSDLNRGAESDFTGQIRDDIAAAIPELDDELRRAYNRLDDLGQQGYCDVHGSVDPVAVADSGALFGEVWRSLYYAFRDPIMDSVEGLEQEAEEIRQTKEQKMIDLTQYEQIKDDAEQRYFEIKSDYDTARKIEQQLGDL